MVSCARSPSPLSSPRPHSRMRTRRSLRRTIRARCTAALPSRSAGGRRTAVSMEGSCTGTLVHPEVVVYAQHCGAGFGSVHLGDSINGTGRSVPTEFCRTYQGGGPGTGRDVAVCKLAEAVTDVEIV